MTAPHPADGRGGAVDPGGAGGMSGAASGAGSLAGSGAGSPAPGDGFAVPPTIGLPTGGGAIRGIGEKFAANPATGTGSLSIPIATSPGRSGFGPTLSLTYDSGQGASACGLGWEVGLAAITRRTTLMLPRYRDDEESDVFLLSGAEDLVPVLDDDGARVVAVDPPWAPGHRVDRYRPRVEGLFARIERWTALDDGEVHWRSITRDDITTVYGADPSSRISDPHDPSRVFSWLICRSHDDRGNVVVYDHRAEDGVGVDTALVHEANRGPLDRSAQRYPKRIRYGNRTPHVADDWMFEVVFDYGEHDPAEPHPQATRPWTVRLDPFSRCRAGFEVRTYRLLRRVLMFHHFPDEPDVGSDCLVGSTDLSYAGDPARGAPTGALLASVTHRGHRRRPGGGYLSRAMPPIELDYTPVTFHDESHDLDPAGLAPAGLAHPGAQLVDLDAEGIAGLLVRFGSTAGGGWAYAANRGRGRFAPPQELPTAPATGARPQLVDLTGSGTLDMVDYDGPVPGFYARTGGSWAPFQPFAGVPTISTTDPDVRLLDVTGNGRQDMLVTEGDALTFYPSLGPDGFGPGQRVPLPHDDDRGPRVLFADPDRAVLVADFSGDGLPDLACVRNGHVVYWQGLGFARFGPKVTMARAPWFDTADAFDHRYLLPADVDGSGRTSLVYVGVDGARVWLNEAGNAFADPVSLTSVPPVGTTGAVTATDLLGTGTPCLVWSSPLPGDEGRAVRYVDLLGGVKPYLLVGMRNNLGTETRMRYTSSTQFYLADRAAGRPWSSTLPFGVFVVDEVVVDDEISGNRFTTRYRYHHGCFDPHEREFCGFGMVEVIDAEDVPAVADPDAGPDAVLSVPPTRTVTWYHTGVHEPDGRLSRRHEAEYHPDAVHLDDSVLPDTVLRADGARSPHRLTVDETREAARALRGSVLREEVYADDDSDVRDRPYRIVEHNYGVELLQPRGCGQRHAVFLTHPRETVTAVHERARVDDPRIGHELTLDVDPWGNPLRSAVIAYPRRRSERCTSLAALPAAQAAVHADQARLLVTATEVSYTHAVDDGPHHRAPQPADSRRFEIVHLDAGGPAPIPGDVLRARLDATADGHHDLDDDDVEHAGAVRPGEPYRRLLDHTRVLYEADDLSGALPLGRQGWRGLVHARYATAFGPDLLTRAYGGVLPDIGPVLADEGGYVPGDLLAADGLFPAVDPPGRWWTPSGRIRYSPGPGPDDLAHAEAHFVLPRRFTDPFGHTTTVSYDPYDLLLADACDPVGNRTTVGARAADGTVVDGGQDYRVLQARTVSDPNGNRTAVAYDALGMTVGTAVLGKVDGPVEGDTLDGFVADLDDAAVAAFVDDPTGDPQSLLAGATTRIVYDLHAHRRSLPGRPSPAVAASLSRETHVADLAPGSSTRVLQTMVYSDGFGRDVQHSALAAPGPVADGGPDVDPRWVTSGWTVYNNKGRPVRQFDPLFRATHAFEPDLRVGVGRVLCYDPLDRLVATYEPHDAYTKTVFDPWGRTVWDLNDTVALDPRTDPDVSAVLGRYLATLDDADTWYRRRVDGALGAGERDAAVKTAVHAGTPARAYLDPLGRPVVSVEHDRSAHAEALRPTRTVLDVEGNARRVIDPLGRSVAVARFGPGGRTLRAAAADSGETITLVDVAGKPVRTVDARGHVTSVEYDALRRPTASWVRHGGRTALRERLVYGDTPGAPGAAANLRTRLHRSFDGAGVLTTARHDLRGNPVEVHRRLPAASPEQLDWAPTIGMLDDAALVATLPESVLEPGAGYTTLSEFDALDRVAATTAPDGSVTRSTYDRAGLLHRVEVRHPRADTWTPYLTSVTYDALGRRTRADTGNGVATSFTYDPLTRRLVRLVTRGPAGVVQDLRHTYDPTGNVTRVADEAQQRLFYANAVVDPDTDYTYDALYRLVAADGREHVGRAPDPSPWSRDDTGRTGLPLPTDGRAMRRYRETYTYDAVGTMVRLRHESRRPGRPPLVWTREFSHREPSAIEPGEHANRLSASTVAGVTETFTYDAHGNTTSMPHLPAIGWDDRDRMRSADRGGGGVVHHDYDATGQRVRSVLVDVHGRTQHERVRLGAFEVFRRFGGAGGVALERETLHVAGGTSPVALVETRTVGQEAGPAVLRRYQYGDHLESSRVELDGVGAVISYEEYSPYGSTTHQGVHTTAARHKRYRFTGKERDDETGFYYHGARYYAPWLCRWTAPDPAGLAGSVNAYGYAAENPVRFTDPDGASPLSMVDRFQLSAGTQLLLYAARAMSPAGRTAAPTTPPPGAPATPRPDDATGVGADPPTAGDMVDAAKDWLSEAAGSVASAAKGAAQAEAEHVKRYVTDDAYRKAQDANTFNLLLGLPGTTATPRNENAENLERAWGAADLLTSALSRGGGPPAASGGVLVMEGTVARNNLFVGSAAAVAYGIHIMMSKGGKQEEKPKEEPASKLDPIRRGSPEWKQAVKNMGEPGRTNVRVKSLEDALELLKEGRPGLQEHPTYTPEKYKAGYELHPNEAGTTNAPHNDLPHVNWKDWTSGKKTGSYGHIFFGE